MNGEPEKASGKQYKGLIDKAIFEIDKWICLEDAFPEHAKDDWVKWVMDKVSLDYYDVKNKEAKMKVVLY